MNALILGLVGTGINFGFIIALRMKLMKHKFSKSSKQITTTFVGMIVCGLFALHEFCFFLADEFKVSVEDVSRSERAHV